MSVPGFENSKIGRRIDQIWIERESLLIQFAGAIGGSMLLFDVAKSVP
jgi:hypothetical protein